MPLPRPCLEQGCTQVAYTGPRCETHRKQKQRERGSATARGYGTAHQKRRAQLLAAEPWCHNPRCTSQDVGTQANPLERHHLQGNPTQDTDATAPDTLWCRRCNASAGNPNA